MYHTSIIHTYLSIYTHRHRLVRVGVDGHTEEQNDRWERFVVVLNNLRNRIEIIEGQLIDEDSDGDGDRSVIGVDS